MCRAQWLLVCLAFASAVTPGLGHPKDAAFFAARDAQELTHRDDWAYPLAAILNRREQLVRIYGQYLQTVVGNNTNNGEASSVASCSFRGQTEGQTITREYPLKRPVEGLSWEGANNTPDYIIDCELPDGDWATEVVLRLVDGTELGAWLKLTEMASERQGAWVACSQPLHTDREWLQSWVEHQFQMGASKVVLNAPQGPHIDELFDETLRQQRIAYNSQFAERSPDNVGTQPLRRFERENVEWFEYSPSPTASYYAEETVFTMCHYRHRYAYDYSTQFDIDEFWVPGKDAEEKTLPEFLDNRLPANRSHAIFSQVYYPLSCATRTTGDYASRYTLHLNQTGQSKPAVRPFSVRRMHVHGMLDSSPEWRIDHPSHPGPNGKKFTAEEALLKHIRPDNRLDKDGTEHFDDCKFGKELDPEGRMAVE